MAIGLFFYFFLSCSLSLSYTTLLFLKVVIAFPQVKARTFYVMEVKGSNDETKS